MSNLPTPKAISIIACMMIVALSGCDSSGTIEIPSDLLQVSARQLIDNGDELEALREDVKRIEDAIAGINATLTTQSEKLASAGDLEDEREQQLVSAITERVSSLIPDMSRLATLEDQQQGLQECLDKLTASIDKMECQCAKSLVQQAGPTSALIQKADDSSTSNPTVKQSLTVGPVVKESFTTGSFFSLRGNLYDLDDYVRRHRRGHVGVIGSIDAHLRQHGASGFEGMTPTQKQQLHDALHGAGVSATTVTRQVSQPIRQSVVIPRVNTNSNCANGNCSRPVRRGLFGRLK